MERGYDGHPLLFDDIHRRETCEQALRSVAHELDRNLLVAAARAGFDDLTLAELGMEDRLAWFVRRGEDLGHGCRGSRAAHLVAKTAC